MWEEVLEWNGDTPSSYIDEVYTQYTSAREKTLALSDVYVNIRPDSSWQHVGGELYLQSELAGAKGAKSYIQTDGE